MPVEQKRFCGTNFFYTNEKDTHPMQASFDAAGSNQFFVCYETKNNRYYGSYPSPKVFYEHYKVFKGLRCFYQVNRSVQLEHHTSKVYLDIEWISSQKDATAKRRVDIIVNYLAEKLTLTKEQATIEDLTRQTPKGIKNSFHIYFPTRFKNNHVFGSWLKREIWPQLKSMPEMYFNEKEIVDFHPYSQNQNFRLPGSSKSQDYTVLELPTFEFFLKTVISGPSSEQVYEYNVPENHSNQNKRKVPELTSSPDKLLEILRAAGDNESTLQYDKEKDWYLGRSRDGRNCLIVKTKRTTNTMALKIRTNGEVWYHCHCDAHEKFAGMKIGTLDGENFQGPDGKLSNSPPGLFVGHLPQQNAWHEKVNVIDYDEKVVECKAIEPTRRCYALRAGMSMGKTQQAKAFLERSDCKRQLLVSTRVAFSFSLRGDFPQFNHYHTSDWDDDKLIVQYESLHNLMDSQPYDVILLDESRSLLGNMVCSKTNPNTQLRINAELLSAFMKTARHVVCLDADLEVDESVPLFLQHVFLPEEIELHRYHHQKMKRTIQADTRSDEFEKMLCDALKSGQKVGLLCRTRKNALKYEKMFKDYMTKIFTSKTSDVEMKEFARINDYLKDVQLLIITSKVTVGANILLPYDKLFVDFTGGRGCSARDMLQMIGRFRELQTVINVLVDESPQWKMGLKELVIDYLSTRKSLTEKFARELAGPLTYDEVKRRFVIAPDWLTKLYMASEVEKRQNQTFLLYALATQRGWRVTVGEPRKERDKPTPASAQAKNEVQQKEDEEKRKIFDELNQCPNQETLHKKIDNAINKLETKQATEEYRNVKHIGLRLRHYFGKGLTYEDFKIADQYHSQIANYAMLLPTSYSKEDLKDFMLKRVSNVSYIDLDLKMLSTQIDCLNDVFQLFGHESPGLFHTKGQYFPLETFQEKEQEIIQKMNDCEKAGLGMSNKENLFKKKNELTSVVLFRRELKRVWGTTLIQKRLGKKKITLGYIYDKIADVDRMARLGDWVELLNKHHSTYMQAQRKMTPAEEDILNDCKLQDPPQLGPPPTPLQTTNQAIPKRIKTSTQTSPQTSTRYDPISKRWREPIPQPTLLEYIQ